MKCFVNTNRRLLAFIQDTGDGYALGENKVNIIPATKADITILNTSLFNEGVMNGRDGATKIFPNMIRGLEGKITTVLDPVAFYYAMLGAIGTPTKTEIDTGIYKYEWLLSNIVIDHNGQFGLLDNDGGINVRAEGCRVDTIELSASDGENPAELNFGILGKRGYYTDGDTFEDKSGESIMRAKLIATASQDNLNEDSSLTLDNTTTYNLVINAGNGDISIDINGANVATIKDLVNEFNNATTEAKMYFIKSYNKSLLKIVVLNGALDVAPTITDTNNLFNVIPFDLPTGDKLLPSHVVAETSDEMMFWTNAAYIVDGIKEEGLRDIKLTFNRGLSKLRLSGEGEIAKPVPTKSNIELSFSVIAIDNHYHLMLKNGDIKPVSLVFQGEYLNANVRTEIRLEIPQFVVKETPKQNAGLNEIAIFDIAGKVLGHESDVDGKIATATLITNYDFNPIQYF